MYEIILDSQVTGNIVNLEHTIGQLNKAQPGSLETLSVQFNFTDKGQCLEFGEHYVLYCTYTS